jgi:hypothetical protein
MVTERRIGGLSVASSMSVAVVVALLCGVGMALGQTNLWAPATAEGTTFTAASAGIYRFTITSGAMQIYSPESAPGQLVWWGWQTELLIYKNRPIVWSGGANAPSHPKPADWDYTVGDATLRSSSVRAEQFGTGKYVDIPMFAGDYVILVANDSQGYFGDNTGGVMLAITRISKAVVAMDAPSGPLVLFKPAYRSPTVTLETKVSPSGGRFNWEITNGIGKVQFLGPGNRQSATLQILAPSVAVGDVTVTVHYTVGTDRATVSRSMTVHQPTSTEIVGGPVPAPDKKGSEVYAVQYTLQVYDQFGAAMQGLELLVQETATKKWTNHPELWTLPVQRIIDNHTDTSGVFADRLALWYIPFIPADFTAIVQQDLIIAGWPVGSYCNTYHSSSASKEPGVYEP